MDCKQTQILLAPYILGDLDNDPLRCNQLQAHLHGCSECTEMYEGFQATIGIVLEHKAEFAQAFKKVREMEEENAVPEATTKRYSTRRSLFIKISEIAACLVIGFGLFFAVNHSGKSQISSSPVASSQQQDPVKIELVGDDTTEIIPVGQLITASDDLKTLRINGNRKMVLNVGTELSIESYNLGCVVKLDQGEVYIEVEHDCKPFIVETTHGRAVITGTTFNIKADHDKMDLAVVEGSVRFESENGIVNVKGGFQSSIIADMKPSIPVTCDAVQIAQWAKGQKSIKTLQVEQPDICFSEMLDLPVTFVPYCDLEDINFDVWIDQRREWFEREFPWTKRLQKLLAQDDIEVDTIDLLIESGDLLRFAWPEYSQYRILAEDQEIIKKIAGQYGIEIDDLLLTKVAQYKRATNIEAFEKWLGAFDIEKSSLALDSVHATAFLINTRSLMWYAVSGDYVVVKNKRQILDLLSEQVKVASDMLGVLNQLLLADKGKSVCLAAQYDEYIKKIREGISLMVKTEREVIGDENLSK